MTQPIPAATLVIVRDRISAPPELLMVERARAMAFAGGAMVFPGGRIDPGDRTLAAFLRPDDADDAAARIAAIRETLEEVGLAIGFSADADALAAMRAALHAGEAFGTVLGTISLGLDLLVPFARWRPDHVPTRTFDARFYLAPATAGAVASVDATENTRLTWTTAADCLAAADRGDAAIIYPTRRNLERLARFGGFTEMVANAARYPVRTITPWIETRAGDDWLCIPDDAGYPVTAERLSAVQRG